MSLRIAGRVARGDFRLDVDLEVAPGEVLAVLGPNGAGKSTSLRIVSGLLALDAGELSVAGRVWDDAGAVWLPPEERSVGLVFQDYRLFPHLTVLDNVAFGPRSAGRGRAASRAAAGPWLERLGVGEYAGHRPPELSGGQAQRVALARALAREPEVLLLDEALAALDSRTKIEVRSELRGHLAAFEGATMLVTHDPLDAMVLADRIAVVERGRVVQEGTPAQIAARPVTEYVARLVGLNLYAGTLSGGAVRLDDGGTLAVATREAEGPVLVAVRPAAITVHLHRPDDGSARNLWPGRIAELTLLGDRVRLEVRGLPDAAVPEASVDVTPAAVADLGLDTGREVWLAAKATDLDTYPR